MELFQDPTFRLWYIAGGMLLLIGPMLWLSRWYHRNIAEQRGRAQTDAAPECEPAAPAPHARPASKPFGMARDIASGRYGQHAKRMQNRVYWVAGLWVAALTVYFGLLIWADEMARVGGGAAPALP